MTTMQHLPRFPDAPVAAPKRLGVRPTIHPTSRLVKCDIGDWTDIGPNCTLMETSLGDYSYLAGDAQMIYSDIGKFCSIASHVRINPGNHPMGRVTQHHMTYRRVEYGLGTSDDADFFGWRREHACVIGHDVWIGHNAIVMPGVSVATGAVVGAGAVVTRDVGPYEIAVGVPARVIKKRFDDATIDAMMRIAWWDWERAELERHFDLLNDPVAFVARFDPGG
jgi:phosphonate metabolism protein (transferase hexapeptide repeat family)